jgi:hypothetical protein
MTHHSGHTRWRGFHAPIHPAVWPGALICVAYTVYGLGMLLQPGRFSTTPAYANLIRTLDIRVWGAQYLAVAALFAVYTLWTTNRLFGIVTHILGLTITGVWLLAFVIRWLTDQNTTVVNVGSWLVLTLVIGRSASLIPLPGSTREKPR